MDCELSSYQCDMMASWRGSRTRTPPAYHGAGFFFRQIAIACPPTIGLGKEPLPTCQDRHAAPGERFRQAAAGVAPALPRRWCMLLLTCVAVDSSLRTIVIAAMQRKVRC